MNDEVLKGYLQHHWTVCTAGVALFRRVGRSFSDTTVAEEVRALGTEAAADRESLAAVMRSVGVSPSAFGATAARTAELLGRLKPNGRIVRRSPLTDVIELEMLRVAVTSKRAAFEVLRVAADDDARLDPYALDRLVERADESLRTLERLHVSVSRDRMLAERAA